MNGTTLDPYATLGLARDASQREVQVAYRRLARRYHPDLHPDAASTARMQRVNQAWEVLSSPERRARYDAQHVAAGPRSGHWTASRRWSPSGPASTAWSGTWASPRGAARTYTSAASRTYDDVTRPGWLGVLLTVVIGLIAFVALFAGVLPFPLAGFAFLVLVSGLFRRFDDG